MSESLDAPEVLDLEKALALSARAAMAWCNRGDRDAQSTPVTDALMQAAAWVARARRHQKQPPLSLRELVEAFETPIDEWLPSCDVLTLVEYGMATTDCEDLVEDMASSILEDIEQRVIRAAMHNLSGRLGEASTYTQFRRFLVEHAWASHEDAVRISLSVGLELNRLYEYIPGAARVSRDGAEFFYPCPRCRWPMSIRESLLSCRRSPSCLKAGAQFRLTANGLIALGRFVRPDPIPVAGNVSLRSGIWRYTVLPGLAELDLAARLEAVTDVEVQLWPYVDAYDLDVRRGEHHWCVDVKDYASVTALASHLRVHTPRRPTWIVVPDERKEQVSHLKRLVMQKTEIKYEFASSSELVRLVKETT